MLQAHDIAPDFHGIDQDGQPISLSQYKGQKVLLYFYPKDDTTGCTAQACNLRDNQDALQQAGYQTIGVSTDDAKSHRKFIDKYQLNFPLVADTDQSIVQAYGVWGEKNEEGIIEQIIAKVDTKAHAGQVLG
jgi:thioredoxin-dependent peroxiredoxin